jgi:hypothetical protein
VHGTFSDFGGSLDSLPASPNGLRRDKSLARDDSLGLLFSPQHQTANVEHDREADKGAGKAGDEALSEIRRRMNEPLRDDAGCQAEHPEADH